MSLLSNNIATGDIYITGDKAIKEMSNIVVRKQGTTHYNYNHANYLIKDVACFWTLDFTTSEPSALFVRKNFFSEILVSENVMKLFKLHSELLECMRLNTFIDCWVEPNHKEDFEGIL